MNRSHASDSCDECFVPIATKIVMLQGYMPKLWGVEVVRLRFSISHMRNPISEGNNAIAEESLAFP